MSKRRVSILASTLLVLGLVSTSYGAFIGGELVNFKPDPVSNLLDEIGWTGSNLVQRPGLVGNADGTLPPDQQTPGGLNIQTPLKIVDGFGNPYPGSTINTGDNSTSFFDVTLQITGLAATAAPVKVGGLVYQWVGAGTFTLSGTDPDGAGPLPPEVLLTGTIDDAVIVGLLGQTTASIQSSTVTYTGGLINTALGGGSSPGSESLSWSLVDIGKLKVVVTGGSFGTTLGAFDGDMTGNFSATPEPATLCLLGVGVTALISRRKK
jgi:hypothetical protein